MTTHETKTKARVLVCEDDDGILEVVTLALSQSGHETVTVTDVRRIGAEAQAADPDIVLLDLHLGGSNGEEHIPTLRNACGRAKIVLMSGHASLSEIAQRHGVDLLPKPFGLEDLADAIRRNI